MTRGKLVATVLLLSLAAAVRPSAPPRPELWVFTGPWDARSDSSLRTNASRIDVAVTGWIALDSSTGRPILPPLFPDTIRLAARVRRAAIVTSWHGDRFHPRTIRTLASDEPALSHAASQIAAHAQAMHYSALVIDFEALERADLNALVKVVRAVSDSAHRHGVSTVVVAVPASDTVAYPGKAIAGVSDFIMPMLYDEHWSTSGPGAISSPDWVRSTLNLRVREVGASRLIAALPTYGYRWPARSGAVADVVSFAEAHRLATDSRVSLARDSRTGTMRAINPGTWEVWVTDAHLLSTLAQRVEAAGVRRIALWRIGTEDPSTWNALGARP